MLSGIEIKQETTCTSPERSVSPAVFEELEQLKFAFRCTICPSSFDVKEELTTHIKNHFKTYVCPICEKEFIGDTSYEYHKTRHEAPAESSAGHAESLVRSCKVCGKELPDAASLKQHMEEEHKPNDDYLNCDYCANTFASKGRLNRHIRDKHMIHLEEAVSCDICGRVCINHEAVTAHRRTHIDEKEFQCDYCGKGFTRKKNLEFHIRSHTGIRPFQCKMCPKTFVTVSGLNCHVRTHTKERPFKCPFCEKCYIHSTDLRRHRRSHGGEEKRFQCDLCPMKFFERKYLTVHLKTHTKIKSQVINVEMVMFKEGDEIPDDDDVVDMDEEYVL